MIELLSSRLKNIDGTQYGLPNRCVKKVNRKVQRTPETKRKSKGTEINARKINKQMHEKHMDQLSLLQAR